MRRRIPVRGDQVEHIALEIAKVRQECMLKQRTNLPTQLPIEGCPQDLDSTFSMRKSMLTGENLAGIGSILY